MQDFENRHVVVTGASSGIGRAVAIAFGSLGATVWMGARNQKALAAVAGEVDAAGGVGRAHQLDVTNQTSVESFAEAVASGSPGVNVLVNNAGVGAWGNVADTDIDTWRRVIDTNLTGPFLVTKAFIPQLRRIEGRRHVLNVVSVAGKTAYAGGGTYSASKFGLRGWTEALALELAEENIRVTAINPGFVATPMVKGAGSADKMVQPDDIARFMVDLTRLPDSMHLDDATIWPWKMYTD